MRLLAWRLDLAHVDPTSQRHAGPRSGARSTRPARRCSSRRSSGHGDARLHGLPGREAAARQLAAIAAGGARARRAEALQSRRVGHGRRPDPLHRRGSRRRSPWTVRVLDAAGVEVASGAGTGKLVDWTWDSSGAAPGAYSLRDRGRGGVRAASGERARRAAALARAAHAEAAVLTPNGDGDRRHRADPRLTVPKSARARAAARERRPARRWQRSSPRGPLAAARRRSPGAGASAARSVPDGRYRLVAEVTGGRRARDAQGGCSRSTERSASSRSTPPLFSPNGDGRRETGRGRASRSRARRRSGSGSSRGRRRRARSRRLGCRSGPHTVTWNGDGRDRRTGRTGSSPRRRPRSARARSSAASSATRRGRASGCSRPVAGRARRHVRSALRLERGGAPRPALRRRDGHAGPGPGVIEIRRAPWLRLGARLRAGRGGERPHAFARVSSARSAPRRSRPVRRSPAISTSSRPLPVDPDRDPARAVHGDERLRRKSRGPSSSYSAASAALAPARVRVLEVREQRGEQRRARAGARRRRCEASRGRASLGRQLLRGTGSRSARSRGRPRRRAAPRGRRRPCCRLTITSFGHLIWVERPSASSTASAVATPPTSESSAARRSAGGRRSTEQRIAVPGGASHARPRRPRPGDLLVAHGDGALGQAGVEQRLRRRALRPRSGRASRRRRGGAARRRPARANPPPGSASPMAH